MLLYMQGRVSSGLCILSIFDVDPAGRVDLKCVRSSSMLCYRVMILPKVTYPAIIRMHEERKT
jgi:hypothetical protein